MSTAQFAVTLLGAAVVAWIYWYFFAAGRLVVDAHADGAGPQRVRIQVKGGYDPSVVRVRAGSPVRLEFHRDETNPCTEEVVLPDFGIRTFLPAHQTTAVSFTPGEGRFEFACGMGMVHGTIIAEKDVQS
jgi:plastocyanin domain-containing protein